MHYSTTWQFKFGIKKTKCCVMGTPMKYHLPTWTLGGELIETTNTLEVLGLTFAPKLSAATHLDVRMSKCRKAFFSLSNIGMSHPCVSPDVKCHLWRTKCSPALTYSVTVCNPTKITRVHTWNPCQEQCEDWEAVQELISAFGLGHSAGQGNPEAENHIPISQHM